MKEYERNDDMTDYQNNPFTLSFGNKPIKYIARVSEKRELIENITNDPPLSHYYVITGVRGSGKTVLLTSLSKYFENLDDYVVVELNPSDDLRESLAAKLYSKCLVKRLFVEKTLSLSFTGVTFSLNGKNPVFNIDDLLERMFQELKKQNKKVLVLIDEATNSNYLKQFALSSQILIRRDYSLFVVMTCLYENISAIESENNLTFLARAPRVVVAPLSIPAIANSYYEIFDIDNNQAIELAKLTKGYAFAFQLLGYLFFESHDKAITASLLNEFDQYLEEFVYQQIWKGLSQVEKKILKSFASDGPVRVSTIMESAGMKKESFSKYRDRLIKKGIVFAPSHGELAFTLPRFEVFVSTRLY